jgi:hypothetical protein
MRIVDREKAMDVLVEKVGIKRSEDFRGVMFVPEEFRGVPAKQEHIAAAVGFNNFLGKTCCMHMWIPKPEFVVKSMICEVFEYAFQVCKLDHVFGPVSSKNTKALDLDRRLGFEEFYRLEGAMLDGSDLVMLKMARENCRWIREEA